MIRGCWSALIAASIFLAATSVFAETVQGNLETLFYSPAERRAISSARLAQLSREFNYQTSISVKGLVRRSPSKGAVWINGQAVYEGQATTSGGVPTIGRKSISLEGHAIRVGETLDLESGSRIDMVPEGAVRVRK